MGQGVRLGLAGSLVTRSGAGRAPGAWLGQSQGKGRAAELLEQMGVTSERDQFILGTSPASSAGLGQQGSPPARGVRGTALWSTCLRREAEVVEPAGKVISVLVLRVLEALQGVCASAGLEPVSPGWRKKGVAEAKPGCCGGGRCDADTAWAGLSGCCRGWREWGAEGGPTQGLGSESSLLPTAFPTNCSLEACSSSMGVWAPPPGGNPTSIQAGGIRQQPAQWHWPGRLVQRKTKEGWASVGLRHAAGAGSAQPWGASLSLGWAASPRDPVARAARHSAQALRGFPSKPGPESLVFLWMACVSFEDWRRRWLVQRAGPAPSCSGAGEQGTKQRSCFGAGEITQTVSQEEKDGQTGWGERKRG